VATTIRDWIRNKTRSLPQCPLCGKPTPPENLRGSLWLAPEVVQRIQRDHPNWQRWDGACPACLQKALLQTLLDHGDASLHENIQTVWPLDSAAAFGALPTPLRMHADPRFTGRGVTMALVDAAFYPHPDLTRPRNRIRGWADTGHQPFPWRKFTTRHKPAWPDWNTLQPAQWHGMMTSTVAAGNGWLSNGLYTGLAPDARIVLVQARDDSGHISNDSITRALQWLRKMARQWNVRVVSLSVAGDAITPIRGNPVDEAVKDLVEAGVTVIAAAGNDAVRRLVPPATAPYAITVGGIDDHNIPDPSQVALWHSNYGLSADGAFKPELVAPSLWVVAPVLPGSDVAKEAKQLFARRAAGDESANQRIRELKLVTPYYQHVEGTSFAAPLVASVVASMLEANPRLGPLEIRRLLLMAARPVPGAPPEREGAGAIEAGRAVALALAASSGSNGNSQELATSPSITPRGIRFTLNDLIAQKVQVLGSWDGWAGPGLIATETRPGVWMASRPSLPPGRYAYRFLLDGARWLEDPANSQKIPNEIGGLDSLLIVPSEKVV
jgi:serine protease AprX